MRKSFLFGNTFLRFVFPSVTEKYNILIDFYNKKGCFLVDLRDKREYNGYKGF